MNDVIFGMVIGIILSNIVVFIANRRSINFSDMDDLADSSNISRIYPVDTPFDLDDVVRFKESAGLPNMIVVGYKDWMIKVKRCDDGFVTWENCKSLELVPAINTHLKKR